MTSFTLKERPRKRPGERKMKQHKITANAYVLTKVHKLAGGHPIIVGGYPTIELAEQAKVRQEETWHAAIVTIHETTIREPNKLDLRIDRLTGAA